VNSLTNPEAAGDADALLEGDLWSQLCRTLEEMGTIVTGAGTPPSARERAEGYRYLARFLAAGLTVCVEHGDPEHPEFGRMTEHAQKWGLDMPDCLYLWASVRGNAQYRIWGHRGSANHLDIQVNAGHFATGDIGSWHTLSSLNGLSLETERDGSFELLLSPAAHPSHPGNRLALEEGAEFVLVRQYFADWESESPADLFIERIGAPVSAPPPAPADMAARLVRLREWLSAGARRWEAMSRALLSLEPNSLIVHRADDAGAHAGLGGQAYAMGNFSCAPDEAVLVEFEPPACRHWSVSLANEYWESLDYHTHQTSLNGHQARLDRDGVFRAVIAHADPGIANWLDTTGLCRGSVAIRFLLASTTPEIRLERIPRADLARKLPPTTHRVSDGERAEILIRRRDGIWRRDRR